MQGSLPFPDIRRGLCLTCSPPQIFILPLSIPYHSGTRRSVLCLVFFILPQIKMTAGRAHQLSKTLLTEPEQHTKLWCTVLYGKGILKRKRIKLPTGPTGSILPAAILHMRGTIYCKAHGCIFQSTYRRFTPDSSVMPFSASTADFT